MLWATSTSHQRPCKPGARQSHFQFHFRGEKRPVYSTTNFEGVLELVPEIQKGYSYVGEVNLTADLYRPVVHKVALNTESNEYKFFITASLHQRKRELTLLLWRDEENRSESREAVRGLCGPILEKMFYLDFQRASGWPK